MLTRGEVRPDTVEESRRILSEGLRDLRDRHRGGASGSIIAREVSGLVDRIVGWQLEAVLDSLPAGEAEPFHQEMALVALGGYGRCELAPYSDVDLMFLYRPQSRNLAEKVANRMVASLWDTGLELGSSMRSISDCVDLALEDTISHTAFFEARHVAGSARLTQELTRSIGKLSGGKRRSKLLQSVTEERMGERVKFGTKLQLLEPDVKRSKGGLRDLHLVRWISWVCCGSGDWTRLQDRGLLTSAEVGRLDEASEFLLGVRHALHFHAGRRQDGLTFEDQVRLSGFFGYSDRPGMLAVETFMQHYYRLGSSVIDILERLIRRTRRESAWRRVKRSLLTHRLEEHYRVAGQEIAVTRRFERSLLASSAAILRLFEVANRAQADVVPELREKIRAAVESGQCGGFAPARPIFLRLLGVTGNLGLTLDRLHSLGILERLIPEFAHARGLIQFNRYHKYTVDEHSLLCVETAESFRNRQGVLGESYRRIRNKELLHLALLVHDLGKGYQEDHCEVGRRIAEEVAVRFSLDRHQSDLLAFLVHRHLLMARLAFRRDVSDEGLLTGFTRQAGTPEALRMLFVLTAADISSIGPESWTSWKEEILSEFFQRVMERLSGDVVHLDPEKEAGMIRDKLAADLQRELSASWLEDHLKTMPVRYLLGTPDDVIAHHLKVFSGLAPGEVYTEGAHDEQTGVVSLTVYTFDDITPGLFSKITGVLSSRGLEILSASITTFGDGLVVDRFDVLDHDYNGPPPEERYREIGKSVREVLYGKRTVEDLLARSGRRIRRGSREVPETLREPPGVRIDNESSERFTILDVFASDRPGLLYGISRAIFELGLTVSLARITTSMDQALDVFYVTDADGRKVTDEDRLQGISLRLTEAIRGLD